MKLTSGKDSFKSSFTTDLSKKSYIEGSQDDLRKSQFQYLT